MSRVTSTILAWAIAGAAPASPPPEAPICTLGPPETLLADGAHGLRYFPDGRLALVGTGALCRVIMAAGVKSVLLEGPTMASLGAPREVLLPGAAGEYDNGYAGINAAWRAPSGDLLAIYHAEDQEGMRANAAGVPGFYCRVALAASRDDGLSFRKIGPILSGQLAKVPGGRFDQGVGEPCLTASPDGKHLHAYYTSHEPIAGRGVQICLARCPSARAADPGAWRKFHDGGFGEPGLGGRDTPVVTSGAARTDALFPHVVHVPELRQFAMLFCLNAWSEGSRPDRSGFYVAFSEDGIRWPRERMQQIWKVPVIAAIGHPVAWHPTLVLRERTGEAAVAGWVCYGFSESWGHRPPNKPHYLMRRPISFTIRPRS